MKRIPDIIIEPKTNKHKNENIFLSQHKDHYPYIIMVYPKTQT